jgi:hypothetical protein
MDFLKNFKQKACRIACNHLASAKPARLVFFGGGDTPSHDTSGDDLQKQIDAKEQQSESDEDLHKELADEFGVLRVMLETARGKDDVNIDEHNSIQQMIDELVSKQIDERLALMEEAQASVEEAPETSATEQLGTLKTNIGVLEFPDLIGEEGGQIRGTILRLLDKAQKKCKENPDLSALDAFNQALQENPPEIAPGLEDELQEGIEFMQGELSPDYLETTTTTETVTTEPTEAPAIQAVEAEVAPKPVVTPAETVTEDVETERDSKKLPKSEVEGKTLPEIAAANDMTLEDLITLNETESSNFKILGTHPTRGDYCGMDHDVYVYTEAAPTPPSVDEGAQWNERVHQEGREKSAELATGAYEVELADVQMLRSSDIYRSGLGDRAVDLPKFLRHKNGDNFTHLFERAKQAEDSQTQEVIRIIQNENGFDWDAKEFRDVVRRGPGSRPGVEELTFKDLTKEKYGKTPSQFFDHYDELTEKINTIDTQIYQTLYDLEDAVKILMSRTEDPAEQQELSQFSYKRDAAGNPEETIDEWESRLTELGAQAAPGSLAAEAYRAAERAFLIIEDIETAVGEGGSFDDLANGPDLKALKEERVELDRFMNNSEKLLDALYNMEEGEELIDKEVIIEDLTPQQETMYSAFDEIDKTSTVTYGDQRDPAYKRTGLMTRRIDPEEAFRRVLDDHGGPDNINWDNVGSALQQYLEAGVMNYFMDPQMDIVDQIKAAGIELEKDEKREIKNLQQEIRDTAKAMEANNRIIETFQESSQTTNTRLERIREKAWEAQELNEELEGTLLELKNNLSSKLADYLGQMVSKLTLDLSGDTPLSEQQKRFVQNGFIIHETLDLTLEQEKGKIGVLDDYKTKPVIHNALQRIIDEDVENKLTYADLVNAANQMEEAMANVEMVEITPPEGGAITPEFLNDLYDQLTKHLPEDQKPPREVVFGIIGLGETSRWDCGEVCLEKLVVGAFVAVPIKDSAGNVLFNFTAGAKIGFDREEGLVAGAGVGISKTTQVSDRIAWTTSLHAGVDLKGVEFAKSETVTFNIDARQNWSVSAGGSLGLKFKPAEGGVAIGGGYHGAVRFAPTMQASIDRAVERGSIESLTQMAEQQQAFNQVLETIGELTAGMDADDAAASQDAMLDAVAEFYKQEMETAGQTKPFPFRVSGISTFSIAGLPVPMLIFSVRGKTRVVPVNPGHSELIEVSNYEIQQALSETEYAGADIYDQMINGGSQVLDNPDYIVLDSGLHVNAEESFQASFSHVDMAQDGLDRFNEQHLRPNGLELTQGTGEAGGLLKLGFPGTLQGEIEIVADPSLSGALVLGPSGSPDDIYIAADQLHGDLIITKQVFSYPRKSHEGGYHRKTIIVIKENPSPKRNYNTFFEEEFQAVEGDEQYDVGFLRFTEDSANVQNHGNGRNVLTWEQYQAKQDELIEQGILFTPELARSAYIEGQARLRMATQPKGERMPSQLREAELEGMIPDLMSKIGTTEVMQYLGNEDYAGITARVAEVLEDQNLNTYELDFLVTVLYQKSYVEVPEAQKHEFAAAHEQFFLNVLTEQFNDDRQLAEDVLEAINFPEVDLETKWEVSPGARCFTAVGRAGVVGFREDVLSGGLILGAVDLAKSHPEIAARIMENMEALDLPTETSEFLNSPETLAIYSQYAFVKGNAEATKLQEIYNAETDEEKAALITKHNDAFNDFKDFVTRLHNAGPGQVVVEANSSGHEYAYIANRQVIAGIRGRCANPSIGIDTQLLVAPLTIRGGASNLQYAEGDYSAFTPTAEFFAGGWHEHNEDGPGGGGGGGEEQEANEGNDGTRDDFEDTEDMQDADEGANTNTPTEGKKDSYNQGGAPMG